MRTNPSRLQRLDRCLCVCSLQRLDALLVCLHTCIHAISQPCSCPYTVCVCVCVCVCVWEGGREGTCFCLGAAKEQPHRNVVNFNFGGWGGGAGGRKKFGIANGNGSAGSVCVCVCIHAHARAQRCVQGAYADTHSFFLHFNSHCSIREQCRV